MNNTQTCILIALFAIIGAIVGSSIGAMVEKNHTEFNLVLRNMARYNVNTGKLEEAVSCKRAVYRKSQDVYDEVGE